jgi:hypothetical protein
MAIEVGPNPALRGQHDARHRRRRLATFDPRKKETPSGELTDGERRNWDVPMMGTAIDIRYYSLAYLMTDRRTRRADAPVTVPRRFGGVARVHRLDAT